MCRNCDLLYKVIKQQELDILKLQKTLYEVRKNYSSDLTKEMLRNSFECQKYMEDFYKNIRECYENDSLPIQ